MPFEFCVGAKTDNWRPAWEDLMDAKLLAVGLEPQRVRERLQAGEIIAIGGRRIVRYRWRAEFETWK